MNKMEQTIWKNVKNWVENELQIACSISFNIFYCMKSSVNIRLSRIRRISSSINNLAFKRTNPLQHWKLPSDVELPGPGGWVTPPFIPSSGSMGKVVRRVWLALVSSSRIVVFKVKFRQAGMYWKSWKDLLKSTLDQESGNYQHMFRGCLSRSNFLFWPIFHY